MPGAWNGTVNMGVLLDFAVNTIRVGTLIPVVANLAFIDSNVVKQGLCLSTCHFEEFLSTCWAARVFRRWLSPGRGAVHMRSVPVREKQFPITTIINK